MAVSLTSITTAGSATNGTSVTTSSVNMTAGVPYLIWVDSNEGSATAAQPATIVASTGESLAGGQIKLVEDALASTDATNTWDSDLRRTSAYLCTPTSTGSRSFAFTWSNTQLSQRIGIVALAGAATGATTGHTIRQVVVNEGNNTSPSATLAAFGSAGNATVAVVTAKATGAWTAGSGFTFTNTKTDAEGKGAVEWRADNDTSVDATINNSNFWNVLAMEVIAAGGGSVVVPVVLSVTIDPSEIPPEEPPEEPEEPVVDEDSVGVPSDRQATNARPQIARSLSTVEIIRDLEREVSDLKGQLLARRGSVPILDEDPPNPVEGSEWINSTTLERCTRVNGVTFRKPL